MYLDNIELFAKNKKELETLIQAVGIYSQEIGMGFGMEKCAYNEKQETTYNRKNREKNKNTWDYWKQTSSNK